MVLFKDSENSNMAILVDDDGGVYSFYKQGLIEFLQGDSPAPFFYANRLATKDGLFVDKRFDASEVYFLDTQERMPLEEAAELLDGEEVKKALEKKREQGEKIDKTRKYNQMEGF